MIGSAKWETYTNGKEEKARVFNEETLLDLRNEEKNVTANVINAV